MHLSDDDCLELALRSEPLESPQSPHIAQPPHLAGCAVCRTEVARLRAVIDAIRVDRSQPEPSPVSLRAAHDLFARRVRVDSLSARVQRWLAVLQFDSAAMLPAEVGVRDVVSDTRQLLFRTETVDLDVSYTSSQPVTLRGQALSRSQAAAEVALRPVLLRHLGGDEQSTCTDLFGAFRFTSVSAGGHVLRVEFEDGEVEAQFEIVVAS